MTEALRDRITDLRRVPASEIRENPSNWRVHPPEQARALREMLDRIGFAGALLVRETSEGLELLDGHLRQDIAGDEPVPVLVVDLDDDEARLLLATLDPLASMAEVDGEALAALLAEVSIGQEDLEDALDGFIGSTLPPGTRETAFLDEAAEGHASWGSETPENPYFSIVVNVTAEDRDVIRAAIARAKERHGLETTPEAMVAIAHEYLGDGA